MTRTTSFAVGIVGTGARTAVGLSAPASAGAVRAALSTMAEHPFMVDKMGEPMAVARDALLAPGLLGAERLQELLHSALQEALTPLRSSGGTAQRVPCFLGLPEPRPGQPDSMARELSERLAKREGMELGLGRIAPLPFGHSAGLMALEAGWQSLERGECSLCLAGGVESYLEPETLEWLDQTGQLMSAENRSGFVPGEAAGVCLLASRTAITQYRLPVLAWIVAIATAQEFNRIKTETICLGQGLTEAIRQATAGLRLPSEKINQTYCDLNGERYRSEEFTFALLRTQAAFVDAIDNVTPASCWGDVGAASGPLFACLAIEAEQRGYAKGPWSLLWTSSEGGQRSAAVLRAPDEQD